MDKNLAVYVCKGCDIGASLDIEALKGVASEAGVDAFHEHDCLCGADGRELIRQGVLEGVNAPVVAACSPRFMIDAFTFDGCRTERVNLREHVVWSHEPNDEDTQMLAEDYLRMGIARAEKATLPEPFHAEVNQDILVVGGGVSGMSAALGAAGAGHHVVLVEKAEELGGWMGRFKRHIPHESPYRDPQPSNIAEQIARVRGNDRIEVFTGTTIQKIEGQPGQFDVTLHTNGGSDTTSSLRVGAIVQATGWKPYDATRLGHLGYGACPNVITNVQMEEQLASGPPDASQRRQAGPAHRLHPVRGLPGQGAPAVLLGGVLPGEHQAGPHRPRARPRVRGLRPVQGHPHPGAVRGLLPPRPGGLRHLLHQGGGGERRARPATTIPWCGRRTRWWARTSSSRPTWWCSPPAWCPPPPTASPLRKLTDAKAVVAKGEAGVQLETAKETVASLAHMEGGEILNLNYRQGPDLPVFKYDFPDSHFICFPYETRRTGIYAAGCVRAPEDAMLAREDGAGAALKAIQTVRLATQGARRYTRAGATCRTRISTCSAARSASAARRSAPSAP